MRQPKILTTLKTYNRQQFVADLLAGATVGMVALPLSLAIAIASGASPEKGLITAIVGGFLISALGGSRVQVGGPTGAFIVVVYSVINEHGYDGLVLATFLAGLLLLLGGHFRLGRLIAYIPEAVINGFTIGIAIIIATSQIKDFLGLSINDLPAEFIDKIVTLWGVRETLNISALGIAVIASGLIVYLRWLAPKLPGLIVAIAVASGLVAIFGLPVDTIESRFGSLPSSLPMPSLPEFSWVKLVDVFPSAILIAFLAGIESLLSAVVADRMIDGQHRPNAELTAQGFANIGSSLFGGLPATGAIARTATNVQAGGQTPVAGIAAALIILLVMLVAAPLAGYMAMPALAALLMITAWNMSEPDRWGEYLRGRKSDRGLLIITLLLTVLVDLAAAIGVGVALGLALRLARRDPC
ncbi:MAG: SulP family inorganic anion transporter [Thiotrichales bacterium]